LVFSELVTKNGQLNPFTSGVSAQTSALNGTDLCIMTLFSACWLNNISVSFPADSAIILENCSATAMDVTDGVSIIPSNYNDSIQAGNNPFIQGESGSSLFSSAT
jgi:hypothetical protein